MTKASSTGSKSREAIFASIRNSLSESRPFDRVHQSHHRAVPFSVIQEHKLSVDLLVSNFRGSIGLVGADCHLVKSEHEAATEIRTIIESNSARKVAVSDSALAGRLIGGYSAGEVEMNVPPNQLFGFDIGLTTAQWGIAETGTLVLVSERETHRLVSLVPPIHICVLEASRIRQTLREILDLLDGEPDPAVTFITGASRTSDIELTLAIGVHGPKKLYVIVLDGS